MKTHLLYIILLLACHKAFEHRAITENQSNSTVTVNVKNYGAKGNGKTDDILAFQKAEDYLQSIGGGTLYVPTGTYIVSKPFYHRSFVTLTGDGDASIIKNKVTISGPDQFCLLIGNFSPSTYASCVHYDINSVLNGANTIQLTNAANANSFFAGQAILIDSKEGFTNSDGYWKPYEAFINRVASVDYSSGIITLENPVSIYIQNAQVGVTDKFIAGTKSDTSKIYICIKPIIKNIRFESNGDWTMRFGVYKGCFENISLKTTDVIPGNGLAYCKFKNIRAQFSQKVIEMAMYSHNTTVDSLTADWYNGASDPAQKPIIKMGENCRDLRFSNLYINTGTANVNFNNVIRHEHSFNDTVENSHFICKNVTGAGIVHEGDASSFVIGNVCRNNIFELGATDFYIQFDNSKGATLRNNVVQYNQFSGNVKSNIKGDTTNNVVSPNYY